MASTCQEFFFVPEQTLTEEEVHSLLVQVLELASHVYLTGTYDR